MKYFYKSKYKFFFKYAAVLLIVFFLGIFTERFDFNSKINNFFKNYLDSVSRFIYSLNSSEKIFIYVEPRHYDNIIKSRELSLKQGKLTEDLEDWVPAQMSDNDNTKDVKARVWYERALREGATGERKDKLIQTIDEWIPAELRSNENSHNIRIRLKGVWPDHWKDPVQWSFKIKVNEDSNPIYGFKRFVVQPPKTLSYLYEWLFMKALEKEGLISLGARYVDVVVNGNSRGAYILQGQVSEEILKKNNRPKGPVIGFSKHLWIQEQINGARMNKIGATDSLNGLEDTFWRSKIDPVQFSDSNIGTEQEIYLKKAIFLLESFRNGSLKTSQVFDTDQLSKVMALRAVLGSSEFDYLDTKFYFNPDTSLLEPISREVHVYLDTNWKNHYYSWWIDSSKIRSHYTNNTNFFIDLLYKDKDFRRKYLSELKNFSETNYYENLINDNIKEFNNYKKILKRNYPTKDIFSIEQIKVTRSRVQDLLDPVQGLNVYFQDYKDNFLFLNVSNVQRLPIEILGLELEDNSLIYEKKPILINGKKPLQASSNNVVKINCTFKEECKKLSINRQKIIFRILGQDREKKTEISQHYYNETK